MTSHTRSTNHVASHQPGRFIKRPTANQLNSIGCSFFFQVRHRHIRSMATSHGHIYVTSRTLGKVSKNLQKSQKFFSPPLLPSPPLPRLSLHGRPVGSIEIANGQLPITAQIPSELLSQLFQSPLIVTSIPIVEDNHRHTHKK